MSETNKIKKLIKEKGKLSINLGSGDQVVPGFINVDFVPYPGVDVVWDLEKYPWPFPSDCADTLIASQLVEHINPHRGGFLRFMDEAWRILKPGGQFMISTPYGGGSGYIQDPTHCNPCNEITWYYFDPIQNATGPMYENYRPMPWKVVANSWYSNGNIEVVLEKRRDDPSYHPFGHLKSY